jgi:hypothetical protein
VKAGRPSSRGRSRRRATTRDIRHRRRLAAGGARTLTRTNRAPACEAICPRRRGTRADVSARTYVARAGGLAPAAWRPERARATALAARQGKLAASLDTTTTPRGQDSTPTYPPARVRGHGRQPAGTAGWGARRAVVRDRAGRSGASCALPPARARARVRESTPGQCGGYAYAPSAAACCRRDCFGRDDSLAGRRGGRAGSVRAASSSAGAGHLRRTRPIPPSRPSSSVHARVIDAEDRCRNEALRPRPAGVGLRIGVTWWRCTLPALTSSRPVLHFDASPASTVYCLVLYLMPLRARSESQPRCTSPPAGTPRRPLAGGRKQPVLTYSAGRPLDTVTPTARVGSEPLPRSLSHSVSGGRERHGPWPVGVAFLLITLTQA